MKLTFTPSFSQLLVYIQSKFFSLASARPITVTMESNTNTFDCTYFQMESNTNTFDCTYFQTYVSELHTTHLIKVSNVQLFKSRLALQKLLLLYSWLIILVIFSPDRINSTSEMWYSESVIHQLPLTYYNLSTYKDSISI